jgi:hypothetical protein
MWLRIDRSLMTSAESAGAVAVAIEGEDAVDGDGTESGARLNSAQPEEQVRAATRKIRMEHRFKSYTDPAGEPFIPERTIRSSWHLYMIRDLIQIAQQPGRLRRAAQRNTPRPSSVL